ncbi:MAG: 30S ribosomal protein S5 [Alphaproteobacteria bacterium]|nr:30S ribosomal protein S5 [Rickettsiales bacterium]
MSVLVSKKVHRRDRIRNVEFEERLLKLARVTKVVEGGRIFSFSALITIGNKNGCIGIGLGKSLDVNGAKRKAINDAKNNLYNIVVTKLNTIPHEVKASFGGAKVMIKPARPGTGIIAGGSMRLMFECLGLKDVIAKSFGSNNPYNVTKATINALMMLKSDKFLRMFRESAISKQSVAQFSNSVAEAEKSLQG